MDSKTNNSFTKPIYLPVSQYIPALIDYFKFKNRASAQNNSRSQFISNNKPNTSIKLDFNFRVFTKRLFKIINEKSYAMTNSTLISCMGLSFGVEYIPLLSRKIYLNSSILYQTFGAKDPPLGKLFIEPYIEDIQFLSTRFYTLRKIYKFAPLAAIEQMIYFGLRMNMFYFGWLSVMYKRNQLKNRDSSQKTKQYPDQIFVEKEDLRMSLLIPLGIISGGIASVMSAPFSNLFLGSVTIDNISDYRTVYKTVNIESYYPQNKWNLFKQLGILFRFSHLHALRGILGGMLFMPIFIKVQFSVKKEFIETPEEISSFISDQNCELLQKLNQNSYFRNKFSTSPHLLGSIIATLVTALFVTPFEKIMYPFMRSMMIKKTEYHEFSWKEFGQFANQLVRTKQFWKSFKFSLPLNILNYLAYSTILFGSLKYIYPFVH